MTKQYTINNEQNKSEKPFNLEERTLLFSKELIYLCKRLPSNSVNFKLIDQVIRSGTSIGANYREANERLGKKDFLFRIRIARKEAKETTYWLELLSEANTSCQDEILYLKKETIELRNIFSSILSKNETG